MPFPLVSAARWIVLLAYIRLLMGAAVRFRKTGGSIGSLPLLVTFWALIAQSQRTPLYLPLAIPATILLIGALILFQWAANSIRGHFFSYIGDRDTPQFVLQKGPFAHIRHPFYASYLLTNTAVVMAFPSWIGGTAALASLGILWFATVFEERKFANSPSAQEYRAYMDRTGRFFPRFQAGRASTER